MKPKCIWNGVKPFDVLLALLVFLPSLLSSWLFFVCIALGVSISMVLSPSKASSFFLWFEPVMAHGLPFFKLPLPSAKSD